MKNLKYIILITAIFYFTGNGYSRLSNNYSVIKKPDKSFIISGKSRTIKMAKGQTYRIKMKLRKNRYYFMSVNGRKNLGSIQYKIIDPNKNDEIIFDNSAYEFKSDITFHNKKERDVIIEIRTMPCCFENKTIKKSNVKLLFANKRINKHENINHNNNYNLYAVN